MKLIILDRDGVINYDSDNYVKSADEWRALPGSIEAIARLSRAGYTIAVATNQSGLSRGLFGIDELEAMHRKMSQLVEDAGGAIDGIFYCPHLPADHCHCRKPESGLMEAIAEEFQTSLQGIPLVGDSLRDLQAGLALGCTPFLVRTGKGGQTERLLQEKPYTELNHCTIFDDLSAVTAFLIGSQR